MDYKEISKKIKNTETEKNLKKALEGEALAHLKYQFYRSKLIDFNKEYETILDEIIHNEKEHGKIWFKLLHNGEVPNNEENLIDAIKGETYEYQEMYTSFGDTAKEEGLTGIAELFYQIAKIEGQHADTYDKIKQQISKKEEYYKSYEDCSEWKCLNCGHIVKGRDAPLECPICNHPQKYFKQIK